MDFECEYQLGGGGLKMIVVVVVSLTQKFFPKIHIANYTETRYNYTKE